MKSARECLPDQITVLVGDDHPVVRRGLTTILNSEEDIKVVGEAADGDEVFKLYNQLSPHVFMLDLRLPIEFVCTVSNRRTAASRGCLSGRK